MDIIKRITIEVRPNSLKCDDLIKLLKANNYYFKEEIDVHQPIQEPVRVEEVRSAEEVLRSTLAEGKGGEYTDSEWKELCDLDVAHQAVLRAMEEYASQWKK